MSSEAAKNIEPTCRRNDGARFQVKKAVELQRGAIVERGEMLNMSATGCCVRSNRAAPPETAVRLRLNTREGPLTLLVEVRWVEPIEGDRYLYEMGMRLVSPPAAWREAYGNVTRRGRSSDDG